MIQAAKTQALALLDGQVCLSSEAMQSIGITENAVKLGVCDHWLTISDPTDARRRWIVYTSLPPVTRRKVDAYYGDIRQALYRSQLLAGVKTQLDQEDANYFADIFTVAEISDLVQACAWLRYLGSNDRLPLQKEIGGYLKLLTCSVDQLKPQNLYGLRVSNIRVLDRRVNAWKEEAHNSLVNKRFANNNASKVDIALKQTLNAWLVSAYGQPNKPDLIDVWQLYKKEANERSNWPAYSLERVRQIIMQPSNQIAWQAARHGNLAANNIILPTVHRRRIEQPDTLWSIDGTSAQLYSQGTGKDGRKQPVKSWYYVLVVDVASSAIIGWAASPGAGEPAELVQRAIRSAVKKNGKAPRFAHYDHAGGNISKETQEVYNNLNVIGIAAQPHNGKSKHIESTIRWFEQKCLRAFTNFVGGNIGGSLDSQANPDLIHALLKADKLPTATQVLEQIGQAVETYNAMLTSKKAGAPCRLDRYMSTGDAGRLTKQVIAAAFWVKRSHAIRYETDGLTIEVKRDRIIYVVEESKGQESLKFREEHLGTRFNIRYDPDDLSSIMLYDYKDDTFVAEAVPKHAYGSHPKDWVEDEGRNLAAILKDRKAEAEHQRQRFAEMVELSEYETIGLPTESGLALMGTKAQYNESMAAAELDSLFLDAGRSEAARLLNLPLDRADD